MNRRDFFAGMAGALAVKSRRKKCSGIIPTIRNSTNAELIRDDRVARFFEYSTANDITVVVEEPTDKTRVKLYGDHYEPRRSTE